MLRRLPLPRGPYVFQYGGGISENEKTRGTRLEFNYTGPTRWMFWKNNLAAVTSCDNDWLPVLILCNDARPLVKAEQSLLVKDINELFKQ